MNKNLQSPTTLTEFAPLSPEPEDSPGITYLFTKLFKRNSPSVEPTQPVAPIEEVPKQELPVLPESRWPDNQSLNQEPQSDSSSLSSSIGAHYRLEATEGRSLPNVLKRISNLLALKSTGLQSYKDTELKQYWMPDSVSKECYDCGEKFTTFRRKHHCRVCGQIFCSRCCNQEIPGKIMGCTGDLRVCTYCGKVVLSYLQSADMGSELSSDLRALQEDLQTKFGGADSNQPLTPIPSQTSLTVPVTEKNDPVRRKTSVGYQEEKFAQARSYSREERSSPLQSLMCELTHPVSGLGYSIFTASQLVDWLMLQRRASVRSQGVAIGQTLLETGYIEGVGPDATEFHDNATTFRLHSPAHTPPPPSSDEMWPADHPHDYTTTDSESDCPASEVALPVSTSLFHLDLNVGDNTVHISRPAPSQPAKRFKINTHGVTNYENSEKGEGLGDTVVRAMVQTYREGPREPGTPVNWHTISVQSLRLDNGERQAYTALSGGFQQHLGMLIKQLLNSEGLAQSWADTILPLAQQVVDTVRPDLHSDSEDMDIRQYIQLKKVSGGMRSDSCIVGGVVCRKNLAHRAMPGSRNNPRILLLSCAIVYQRVEGRLMSLEPVMMQEQEYLRHTVARIAAMGPDLVLVQRNVSRLAQERLLQLGISLVLNVKPRVLERVARMTGAVIVHSIDAQVGRPQLGTCSNFYIKTFTSETGATKTLMFLEGCSLSHLGCTVLLRGAPIAELAKVKRVTSWLIYALYNWRLELSFLMDEFAKPPSLVEDNFFEEDTNVAEQDSRKPPATLPLSESALNNLLPTQIVQRTKSSDYDSAQPAVSNMDMKKVRSLDKENINGQDVVCNLSHGERKNENDSAKGMLKLSVKDKSVSEERRMNVESISDFSDPLHLYLNLDDEVFSDANNEQSLSVSELPQANRFRKALDDTLLSVSPFLKFSVPYLETESGRNCLLRRYFPQHVYWTAQLQEKAVACKQVSSELIKDPLLKLNGVKLGPVHPFVTAKLTQPITSHEVQTMLAFYRANGGRLPQPSHNRLVPAQPPPPPPAPPPVLDALDPAMHQRLSVLFCSYSHESPNAPAFCVNPWVFQMDYYGSNDIPLGAFLERYCFRSSYVCPSERCNTPMLKHVRRFVHDGGSVQISLREIEGAPPTDDDSILMWTYCPMCNRQVSQVTRMSPDTWAFSFAKYLEQHFHAGVYCVRGSDCTHSLHQVCRQFFGHKNAVAYFQYDKISVWEISLPPPLLVTHSPTRLAQQDVILEEVKRWALNGYEVFSAILNQLCTLASNGEAGAMVMKQQLQKEQAVFKNKVEELQLRLTSPTHTPSSTTEPRRPSVWHMEDSLVLLKRSIAEAVIEWNVRLSDAEAAYIARKREEKNKKTAQDAKSSLSTSAGLSDIIDGVAASQVYEGQGSEASGLVGRKSLPSQLSQSSLHSATDVMDIEDYDNTLADDSIFRMDTSDQNTESKPSSIPETSIDNGIVIKNNVELLSDAEEINQQISTEHDIPQMEEDPGNRESHSSKQQLTDRVSVKQILSQLLPKDTPANTLQCPMSPQEHHMLPLGLSVPVIVYEREPSSIIAYALSCHDYRIGLEELLAKRASLSEQPSPSPLLKRKSGSLESKDASTDPATTNSRKAGVLSFLRQTSSSGNLSQGGVVAGETVAPPVEVEEVKTDSEPAKVKGTKDKPSSHLEVQFSDSTANFIVKIYYAEEFARLRAAIFPAGEEAFVRSLCRCVQWAARGGKSGSNFAKTKDDRFILKEMSRTETHPFMDSAPQYFDYMDKCAKSGSPTLLGKIVGVYRVIYRGSTSNATFRSNLLVMENLFYGRSVKHKFDLKGSVRNRLVNPLEQGGEIVLLDENLINMTCDNPLYILPHSKTVLMQAIQADTQFLASLSVMDYSLLVGLDEGNKELVVGIIDYIRTFTWDKKLETMVKKSGLLGGQGKLPTIVSPDEYRDRFIAAMHRYFLPVPDRWTGLGKGLDF